MTQAHESGTPFLHKGLIVISCYRARAVDYHYKMSLIIVFILIRIRNLGSILPNRDLDTLTGKRLAERRALDNAGELFRAVNLERIAEGASKDWSLASGETVAAVVGANVDEVHLEPTASQRDGDNEETGEKRT